MKTSGHLILYISEQEDFELWRALSQISPEDRAAFVKSVLRRALSQGHELRNVNSNNISTNTNTNANSSASALNSHFKQNNILRMDKSLADNPAAELALGELGYHGQASEEKTVNPFKYLDNELQTKTGEMGLNAEMNTGYEDGDDLGLIDLNELEVYPSSDSPRKGSLPGLDFLLNNVIGEEDDEKVIEFIRKAKPQIDKTS